MTGAKGQGVAGKGLPSYMRWTSKCNIASWFNAGNELYCLPSALLQLHLGTRRVTHRVEPTLAHQTVGPDFTSRLMVLRSNRRRKRLQVTLLSLSPWPRPRLSSCISRRSKITSSWPGEVNSELQFAKPRSKQTQALGADTPPQVLRGKGQ